MSLDLLSSGSAFIECATRLVDTYPADIVVAVKQRTNGTDGDIFRQQTAALDAGFAITLPAAQGVTDGSYRNVGGANGVTFTVTSSRALGAWKWYRFRLTSISSRQLNVDASSITSSTTVTNDFTSHDRFTLGATHWNSQAASTFLDGQIAELGVFNGGSISDTDFASVRAGTLYLENVAGVTTALSMLTKTGTSLTASDGKVFTFNGTVTQGADHPVTRSAPDTTAPTLSSAAVANGTPTIVNLTMSEAMDTGNIPVASAFTVSGHTVSSVAITGSTINLTVSAAFVNGEAARTVAYTQPGTNNARDVAGNLLANFTGQAITNNVAAADTTAPTFSTAQVANAAPTNIVITMSETLAAFTPATSAFAVSGGKTVSSVSRSGATITLTCSAAYAFGDTITVTYTKPGTNMLQDTAGNQTASFGPSAVTNNVSSGASVTITSPSAGGKRVADGTYRASIACNVTVLDKTTHAVLERKTGLTSPASGAFSFTSTVLTAGTERLFLVKADADDKDLGVFFATPV